MEPAGGRLISTRASALFPASRPQKVALVHIATVVVVVVVVTASGYVVVYARRIDPPLP